MQADHQARRQAGAATVHVERLELRPEPAPVDQPGQAHQRMPLVHQVHQPGAEEILLRLGLGLLGAHRRASIRDAAGRITPRPGPQPTCRFARFSPPTLADPANPDASQVLENRRTPPLSANFTGDYLYGRLDPGPTEI